MFTPVLESAVRMRVLVVQEWTTTNYHNNNLGTLVKIKSKL